MADVITRLKVDSQEYDSKIKRAAQGILQLESSVRKAGESFIQTWKEEQDFVKGLGQMQTMSNTARGKIAELTSAFTDLSMVYRRMSDEEKKSPFGQGLKSSLDQLKGRIQDAKRDLNSVNAELTNWRDVLGGVGQKLGINSDLLGAVTSGTIGLTAAIGAGATAVGAAAKAWADYNSELAKQDQITTVTTGLKGVDANRMTDAARAIADTYNVDFREAINAANTLMSQFGETGDSTIQLLRDGMQGMIEGDGGKLLSMIQQYAPAFRDAGVSASQLVAVIQNSEGGIFTDQNMNAIVFGIKNIRLMTKATSDALAQLGIDGQKMSKQLSDGSLTIFDALKQVATQMQRVESGGKTAGEVMQAVFGRQGTMAGTNLAKAIAGLNTNLEETKLQTGDVGKSLSELELAQERLNSAMREAFEFDGWDSMSNTIKTKVVNALADVVTHLHDVGKGFAEVGEYVAALTTFVPYLTIRIADFGLKGVNALDAVKLAAQGLTGPLGNIVNMLGMIGSSSLASSVNDDKRLAAYKGVYDRTKAVMSDWFQGGMIDTDTPPPPPPPKGSGGTAGSTTDNTPIIGSIDYQTAKVQELQKAWRAAADDDSRLKIKKEIEEAQFALDILTGKTSGMPKMDFDVSDLAGKVSSGIQGQTFQQAQFDKNNPWKLDDNTMKAFASYVKDMNSKTEVNMTKELGNITSGISNVVGGIEALGIELPEGVKNVINGIQGVVSILSGISTILTAIEAISTANAIIPFAHGGIIRAASGTLVGNSYSGDNLRGIDIGGQIYGLNAGEVVLNRAQVGNLSSILQGAGGGGYTPSHISGEQIWITLNRYTQRTGKGELVTWK